jgi:starvation-inducible DNA-binding protein
MKTIARNEIFDEKTTTTVVNQLQPILIDLIALALITKQAHWNVVGPHFRSLHLHLDEIYAGIQGSVDVVAERIATLAASPNGQADEVSRDTTLSQLPPGFLKDVQVIDLMTERVAHTVHAIRERMAKIEDVDTVTADLLHAVVDGLEKHLWMLRSQGM